MKLLKNNKILRHAAGFMAAFTIFTFIFSGIPAGAAESDTQDTSWPEAPSIVSGSAILIDADTGGILYQKNAHEQCYPASTTKILTGLLTIENCNMNETVTFSTEAANSVTWEDASLGTKPGEQYSVEQALYGLLLYSANEIANGLAEHISGEGHISDFVDMMNKRAKELGAVNTHFNNPNGLYDPNHYTTAYDMAMIARGCYNNATFVNIDSTFETYTIGPTNKTTEPRTFRHRHKMLKNREYYYEYCKGGKTGYTDQSGSTLVTFAEKDNMRLICVCFKSTDNDRFTDTKTLFDWGFNNFKKITASNDTVNSLFSSANYYNSPVFNKYNLDFKLNASNLTIPNNASTGDITLALDNNYEPINTDNRYTANINFTYGDNIVGATSLVLSPANAWDGNENLPYIDKTKDNNTASAKKCLVINIWILAAVIIVIYIIIRIAKNKDLAQRRHLRARVRRRRRSYK